MSETTHGADCGCTEYNELSRRQFVAGSVGAALFATVIPPWLPKVVLAQTQNSTRDVIVHVFLRGGADGLSMVVPFLDANYYAGRGTIAIPRPDSAGPNRSTALDGQFAFPRAFAQTPMLAAYQARELLLVHQAGLTTVSRSHFDAQRWMEVGKAADPNVGTGWLGRHLATSAPMRSFAPLRGIGFNTGLPTTLNGAPKTLPIPNAQGYTLGGSAATQQERIEWLKGDHSLTLEPLRSAALDTGGVIDLLRSINFAGYRPSNAAVYPTSGFGNALRSAAALIKADVGVEAIQVDIGGWDTHASQDPNAGSMFRTMSDLAGSLGAFWADVMQGAQTTRVTLVAMSEFGRNVRENGSQGTDHGRGGVMFVMGKAIAGGRVMTNNWQPLARENLELQQDLRVTIDHRDVLAEIVRNRLGNNNLSAIFPEFTPTIRGVTR